MHLQQPWYERTKKTISRPPGVLTMFGFHFAVSSPANNAKLLAEQPEAQKTKRTDPAKPRQVAPSVG